MKSIKNYTDQRTYLEGFGFLFLEDRGSEGWQVQFSPEDSSYKERIWIKIHMKDYWKIVPIERLFELYKNSEEEQVLTPYGEEVRKKDQACEQLTEEIDFAVENYNDARPVDFLNRIVDATSKYRTAIRYEI